MAHAGINLAGFWTVHGPDGSIASDPAKIAGGAEPGMFVFTNENGETSHGGFISPTLLWAADYGLYAFVLDSGNTLMWRHSNTCWLRKS